MREWWVDRSEDEVGGEGLQSYAPELVKVAIVEPL